VRRYKDIGRDAKTDENCSGGVAAATGQQTPMNDHAENAAKRKWADIVAINVILLLTAGLLIVDHLTRSGQLAALMANITGTPEPTPIGPGIDVALAIDFLSTSPHIATLRNCTIVDGQTEATITLQYELDPALTSKQVDVFAMKQANKAEQIKGCPRVVNNPGYRSSGKLGSTGHNLGNRGPANGVPSFAHGPSRVAHK
jgi:hypothetical protein